MIILTERADKTENRDPNVFNFVYLFIILGKRNEDGYISQSWIVKTRMHSEP